MLKWHRISHLLKHTGMIERVKFGGPDKGRFRWRLEPPVCSSTLFRAGVLRDCLCPFRNSMLCQFTWQQKPNSCLDFPTCYGWSLVVMSQSRCLRCNPLKNVVDETIHDTHCFTWYTSIGMNLLQYFININGVTFLSPTLLLLVTLWNILLGLSSLFGRLPTGFWRHFCSITLRNKTRPHTTHALSSDNVAKSCGNSYISVM